VVGDGPSRLGRCGSGLGKGGADVSGHGDIESARIVVPFECPSTEHFGFLVNGDSVVFLQGCLSGVSCEKRFINRRVVVCGLLHPLIWRRA
jgi:hypothetical protein